MNPINNPARLTALLTMFVGQLPVLLVSLVGCIIVVARWNRGTRAAAWALAGFGLSLALCVVVPLGQMQVQKWMAECGQTAVDAAWVYTFWGLVWSVLRAISYGCLLFALVTREAR